MRIAVVSDDETSISQHFGRALYYVIIKVEDGKVICKETRPKIVHHNANEQPNPESAHECHHGYGADAHIKHKSMIETVSDCAAIIAGGMGLGAYESLKNQNIDVVVTDVKNIDEAAKLYLVGKLPNLMQRLH
ncbi:MAG: NifB/NifX family molybdenum-iron cluster-binding protein [Chloroflexota bacterium]